MTVRPGLARHGWLLDVVPIRCANNNNNSNKDNGVYMKIIFGILSHRHIDCGMNIQHIINALRSFAQSSEDYYY